MNTFIGKMVLRLLGRRMTYRVGRALYHLARGDTANDMVSNGERFVQRCVVNAWKQDPDHVSRRVVLDVGANVGDWSASLLDRLQDGTKLPGVELIAFEPVPAIYATLQERLGSYPAGIRCEQLALSSENGTHVLHVGSPNAGTHSLHAGSPDDKLGQIEIVTMTVADYCRTHGIEKIHLLKCDAEGHDLEIIRGALPMLATGRIAVLQFEYNHRWVFSGNHLRDVFLAFEGLPYRFTKLQPDHLLVFNRWHPELEKYIEGNYALVHADALAWFPIRQASWDRSNTLVIEPL